MVLVVAALSGVALREVVDELDLADPLDMFEAELVLDPQTQRPAVQDREALIVHLVGQQALGVTQILNRVGVVIAPTSLAPSSEGIEHHPLGLWSGTDEVDQLRESQAAPLRDAGPALDAVMQSDLLLLAHGLKLIQ